MDTAPTTRTDTVAAEAEAPAPSRASSSSSSSSPAGDAGDADPRLSGCTGTGTGTGPSGTGTIGTQPLATTTAAPSGARRAQPQRQTQTQTQRQRQRRGRAALARRALRRVRALEAALSAHCAEAAALVERLREREADVRALAVDVRALGTVAAEAERERERGRDENHEGVGEHAGTRRRKAFELGFLFGADGGAAGGAAATGDSWAHWDGGDDEENADEEEHGFAGDEGVFADEEVGFGDEDDDDNGRAAAENKFAGAQTATAAAAASNTAAASARAVPPVSRSSASAAAEPRPLRAPAVLRHPAAAAAAPAPAPPRARRWQPSVSPSPSPVGFFSPHSWSSHGDSQSAEETDVMQSPLHLGGVAPRRSDYDTESDGETASPLAGAFAIPRLGGRGACSPASEAASAASAAAAARPCAWGSNPGGGFVRGWVPPARKRIFEEANFTADAAPATHASPPPPTAPWNGDQTPWGGAPPFPRRARVLIRRPRAADAADADADANSGAGAVPFANPLNGALYAWTEAVRTDYDARRRELSVRFRGPVFWVKWKSGGSDRRWPALCLSSPEIDLLHPDFKAALLKSCPKKKFIVCFFGDNREYAWAEVVGNFDAADVVVRARSQRWVKAVEMAQQYLQSEAAASGL